MLQSGLVLGGVMLLLTATSCSKRDQADSSSAGTDFPRGELQRPLSTQTAEDEESARKQLEKRGIQYNEDTFLDCVEKGDSDTTKLFLVAGMNPNAKSKAGQTALMLAAFGHLDTVKALLNKGADVNAKDDFGETAL